MLNSLSYPGCHEIQLVTAWRSEGIRVEWVEVEEEQWLRGVRERGGRVKGVRVVWLHVCKRVTGCFLLRQCIRVVMVKCGNGATGKEPASS